MGLLFGCMYIIRFGSMRKTYRAAEWALVSDYPLNFISFLWVYNTFPSGSEEYEDHLVECVGFARHASHLAYVVRCHLPVNA